MSILDVFTVKKDFLDVFNTSNINFLSDFIKEKIKAEIKNKITGEEKMQNVIKFVVDAINSRIHSKNKIVQWVIDNILIKNVRTLIQIAYDHLKEVVKDL